MKIILRKKGTPIRAGEGISITGPVPSTGPKPKAAKTPVPNAFDQRYRGQLDARNAALTAKGHGVIPKPPQVAKVNKKMIQQIAAGGGGGGSAVDVVGADGKLNAVQKHSSWTTPSAYPTEQRTSNGSIDANMDANGHGVFDGGTLVAALYAAYIFLKNGATANLQINASDITHDMGVKEVDVCNSGSPGKMLVIGSDPY